MNENISTNKNQIKVCLIDDDENFREIYSVALQKEGFCIHTADNGKEGLELVRKEYPDIILLDLQMSKLDGFEVLKNLSSDKSFSKIPVIILSNNDKDVAFEKVGTFETKFFLVKILTTPKEVAGIIREILSV